jgi:hypothetical protein
MRAPDNTVVIKKKTWARGRPAHIPTEEQRIRVQAYATVGTPHNDIAILMGITLKTLLKRYRLELDRGKAQGNAQMGGRLYKAGMNGNIAAMIFWMKSQAGWREKEPTLLDPTDGVAAIDSPVPMDLPMEYTPEMAREAYLRLTQD